MIEQAKEREFKIPRCYICESGFICLNSIFLHSKQSALSIQPLLSDTLSACYPMLCTTFCTLTTSSSKDPAAATDG